MFDILEKHLSAKNIIFFIIAILFIIFITKIKDIAILFFASFVMSCSLNPIVEKLEKKIKRPMAAFIVLFSTVLLISALLVPIVVMAGYEIKDFLNHIPQYIETVRVFVVKTPFIDEKMIAQINFTDILPSISNFTTGVVNESITFSINFVQTIIYLFAALIIIYYFMADKAKVRDAYMKLFPKHMKIKAENIIDTISEKIGGYVIAQLVTISSVGIIMIIGLLLIRVDYAILLGLITAILDLIPVIGPAIGLIICLVASAKLGLGTLAMIVLIFAIAQWVENNFVRPYVFGKFMNIHPLLIFLFLLITAQYIGIVGVVFAPAIAATVCVLIEELYIKNVN